VARDLRVLGRGLKFCPQAGGADADHGKEVASRLFIAGSDASKVLQPVEEAFDQVAMLIERRVEVAAVTLSVGVHGDVGPATLALKESDDPIRVIAFVAEHDAAGDGLVEELAGRRHIMRLTGGQRQP
jgi:hypothetical protein